MRAVNGMTQTVEKPCHPIRDVHRAALGLLKMISGEATADTEPFMLRKRTDEEIADYDKGFEVGQKGQQNDDTKSEAWQRDWAEAQE